jgi:hypothetical protein
MIHIQIIALIASFTVVGIVCTCLAPVLRCSIVIVHVDYNHVGYMLPSITSFADEQDFVSACFAVWIVMTPAGIVCVGGFSASVTAVIVFIVAAFTYEPVIAFQVAAVAICDDVATMTARGVFVIIAILTNGVAIGQGIVFSGAIFFTFYTPECFITVACGVWFQICITAGALLIVLRAFPA